MAEDNQPEIQAVPIYTSSQYAKHADLVKKTNDWLINNYQHQLVVCQERLTKAETSLEVKAQDLNRKELQLQLAYQELNNTRDASLVQFILGLLSLLLSGIGINLVTTIPTNWVAWVMIGSAIVVQCISFYLTYRTKKRRNP